jgi:hypothetical protein
MVLVPDATVLIQDAPPPVTALNDTGTKFLIGLSARGKVAGPVTPDDALHSYDEWIAANGAAQSYNLNEARTVKRFFDEGGSRLFFSRIVGPAAAVATGTGTQWTVAAKGPGSSYNTIKLGVASGIATVKDGSTVLETSPPLATVADLQAWTTAYSDYVIATPSLSAAIADQADVTLSGGSPTDDRTNITDTQRQTAIDRFGKDLGPGQVGAAGDSRSQMHAVLAAHAVTFNRIALCDPPDTATASTIAALGTTIRALGRETARHCALLGDWLSVPGEAAGTPVLIPPSGIFAGLCARNDAQGNPNHSIAEAASYSRTALSVHYSRSAADLQAFANAGVIPFVSDGGLIMPNDDITPVDPSVDEEWWELSTNRFFMRVIQDLRALAKAYMFRPVTGTVDYAGYEGAVRGYLSQWMNVALFGDTPADAYRADAGSSVNTAETIRQKKLRVALSLHAALNVRNAEVLLSNIPIGEAL